VKASTCPVLLSACTTTNDFVTSSLAAVTSEGVECCNVPHVCARRLQLSKGFSASNDQTMPDSSWPVDCGREERPEQCGRSLCGHGCVCYGAPVSQPPLVGTYGLPIDPGPGRVQVDNHNSKGMRAPGKQSRGSVTTRTKTLMCQGPAPGGWAPGSRSG
jgi:hypothetical protein